MIKCPHCGHDVSKVDSQPRSADGTIRRYRVCKKCHKSFTTVEYLAVPFSLYGKKQLVPDIPVSKFFSGVLNVKSIPEKGGDG